MSAGAVSAIVVSYYTGPVLLRAIDALLAAPEIAEIILVDNGNPSADIDSARAREPSGARLCVITGHGNIGFAAACNLAATKATGEHLLFINPDAILPQGGAAQLLEDAASLKRPCVLGAKLVNPDGGEQRGSRRETLTPWRAFVEMTRIYKLAPRHPYFRRFNLHDGDSPEKIIETPTISGACFFIHCDDYFLIGGMDERYFLHVEDVDFCLRLADAGGRVYFTPNVDIIHFKSSSRANAVRIEYRKTVSMMRYFNAHFSKAYPAPFLWLVYAGLWAAFGVLVLRRAVSRTLRLLGVRLRRGAGATRRAKSINARKSSR